MEIREVKIAEFKRMLCLNFNLEIKIKLHFSHRKDDDYVYGIYQGDKKFWLWKTSDVCLGEISTADLSLPFNGEDWEDLKIVIIEKTAADNFVKFAKEYEIKTGKTVVVESMF